MKIILKVLKWILILLILLLALATFMGRSYGQTFILLLAAATLLYWPAWIRRKFNTARSAMIRLLVVITLFLLAFVVFGPDPKQSIYTSQALHDELMHIYDRQVKAWPAETEDIYIPTVYGDVHVLTCGNADDPPLLMFHAASMGAPSWAENIAPLLGHYRIYAIDNPGEGNKSELYHALTYPKNGKEIADLYALLADSLGIDRAPIFGASNGGFIAMKFAFYHPERVESLVLFGPMGLTQLTGKSIFMLAVASMYPFQLIRDQVTEWALGDDDYVLEHYSDWFNCIMKATIPSVAQPVPMTSAQKKDMQMPVLLFLGTKDNIVGDAKNATEVAADFPDVRIETLESGHLIAVEKAVYVNGVLRDFLGIE